MYMVTYSSSPFPSKIFCTFYNMLLQLLHRRWSLATTAVASQMVPSSAYLVSDCSVAGIFLQQLHHSFSEAFPGSYQELAHYWGLLLPRLLLHVIRDATSQGSSLRCTTLLLLHCRGGRSASPFVGVPRPTTPPLC